MVETPDLIETKVETILVGEAEVGVRLDRVLATHATALSRTRLKALILAGRVAVGGRTIRDPGHRVNAGDRLTLAVPPPEEAAPRPEPIPLALGHEDDDLIVLAQPGGLVGHPAPGTPTGPPGHAPTPPCRATL